MADPVTTSTERASALNAAGLPQDPAVAALMLQPLASRLVLRCRADAMPIADADLAALLGGRINTAFGPDAITCTALRLGPDEWLMLSKTQGPAPFTADLTARLGAIPHALTDITHRNEGLLLSGPAVEAVLAAGCPLPLDLAAFPVGRATRTLLAKAEIVLWRREPDTFHIEVARSFAPYLVALIAEAIANEAAIGRMSAAEAKE